MIHVVDNRVAIVPVENPIRTRALPGENSLAPDGLHIPHMAQTRINQGFVKYRGPNVIDLKIGDYVLFSGYTGTLTHIEGEGKLIVMPEDFVVAKIEMVENLPIPGVYFTERIDKDAVTSSLFEIIATELPDLAPEQCLSLAGRLMRRGCITQDSQPYYTARYELIMEYIAAAFADNKEWMDAIKIVKMPMPTPEEYDYMRVKDSDRKLITSNRGNYETER